MHAVAVNWRDLRNPLAGGAEVHLEKILEYLGCNGWRCTLLCSRFPGSAREEQAEGYRIVRAGHERDFNLVAPWALRRLLAQDPADVVIDDINKIPFFTPLFTRTPVLAMVPHLMGDAVFREAPPWLAAPIWLAERPVPWAYRHCHFEAISESTRDDLVARGIPREQISVVLCGLDHDTYFPSPDTPKSEQPSIVYVGRIKRYKNVDHILRALPRIRKKVPGAHVTIIGEGDGIAELRKLSVAEGIAHAVRFTGYLPTPEKVDLIRRAHVLVNPSYREGWGLTNVEANACGTICVAADSPGLRDSVRHGVTGLLYRHEDLDDLAETVTRILRHPQDRKRMERQALAWAGSLTWQRCGSETHAVLQRAIRAT